MPEYEFFNQDGEYRTAFFHADDAPKIGEIIEHEGESLRRVPSLPGVTAGFQPFASSSLAPNDPDAPHHDAQGRPSFQSEREVREFMARNNENPNKPKLAWDD
ncbi:MAG: hypothetical protein ACX94C_07700 [Phycisphaerales bacterium]